MPADPYASVRRLIATTSVVNMSTAVSIINRIAHDQNPGDNLPPGMREVIEAWWMKWRDMGRNAADHMLLGRGLNGHPFGVEPSPAESNAANSALIEAVRAIAEGRRLRKGAITDAEQAEFLRKLDSEDAVREFFQVGKVHAVGAGVEKPLLFWRRGNGDASAVAEAYRAGKVERPWDPVAADGEAGFISDWVLLYIAFRKGLSKWVSVLPQVRRRIGPFLRHRTVRKAHRETRACVERFQKRGLIKGMDQKLWAGWCTPEGLELVHRTIRPAWEDLAGLSRSANSPRTW